MPSDQSIVVPASADRPDNGLFDPWYYALQTGVERDATAAWDDYVADGAELGLLANPLTDFDRTGLAPQDRVAALRDGSARLFPLRPLLDDLALVADFPAAAEHAGGPAGYYLSNAHAGAPVPSLGNQPWTRFVRVRRQQAKSLAAILDSGMFDTEYYALQVGRAFHSDRQAVWHFLEVGEQQGLSPLPLYERDWFRRTAKVRGVQTYVQFLRDQQAGEAGPHFDASQYLAGNPEAARHRNGAVGHFMEHATHSTMTVPNPQGNVPAAPWERFCRVIRAAAAEYGEQAELTRTPDLLWADWCLDRAEPAVGPSQPIAIVSDARAWNGSKAPDLAGVYAQVHTDWTMHIAVDATRPVPTPLAEMATDPRFVLVPTAQESWGGRLNDVVASVREPWTCWWVPGHSWAPSLLSGLLAAASDGRGAYVAVHPQGDNVQTVLPRGEALLWSKARSLAGMLVPTQALTAKPFRPEAADQFGWDFLLRSDLDPVFAPFVGVRGAAENALPLNVGMRSVHDQVLRDERLAADTAPAGQVATRVTGRVSLLVSTTDDRILTRAGIRSALDGAPDDTEVVVVAHGSPRSVTALLASCFAGDRRVAIKRLACDVGTPTALNVAFGASTGETVVFLDHATVATPGWLPPLVEVVEQPDVLAAQPLLLHSSGSVASAGTVFHGPHTLPTKLLADHPVDDALRGDPPRLHAVGGACLAMWANRFAASGGFNPVLHVGVRDADLCLRLAESEDGHFITVRESRVAHVQDDAPTCEDSQLRFLERWGGQLPGPQDQLWEQAGFAVVGRAAGPTLPASGRRTTVESVLVRPATVISGGLADGLPSLRWAIKNAATGGRYGDTWGDTFFAEDLAAALRTWGQEAFVDRRGAHARPGADHLDDVTLTLRGRVPAVAQPGATNVVWVISHPDDVTTDEMLQGFDLIYSAGPAWAEQMTRDSGIRVRPLLQATNTQRFTPEGERIESAGVLFVGRPRGVMRAIVGDCLAVGADVQLYGNGWEDYVAAEHIAAPLMPNEQLPAAYRGARIVLNDHWADMARLGFLSNRLFDAVASGARVISDQVAGLDGVFGSSVRTYQSLDELRALLDPDGTDWAGDDEIAQNAQRVAANHSFTERARVLLADVLDARGVEHNLHRR